MSAYLKFFALEQSPFEGTAQSQVVLGTRALRDAFGTIRTGLDEGASRICVSGSAGLGKTSLARALPKLLGDEARVATVPDAGVRWAQCRDGIARQWGLGAGRLSRAALVDARADGRLVLVIDQAERATEDFLDHLDVLLSYRTEADTPVVQSILLANLATREGESPAPLLWWLDRIQTLQLEFAPLPRDGVASYIAKHLRRAGWRGETLFSEDAGFAIHGYAGGVPGEISALCEKLLVEAASRGRTDIDADFVHAICDPEPEDDVPHASALDADDPDAAWTVPDEFEALMAEAEFSGAEDTPDDEATEDAASAETVDPRSDTSRRDAAAPVGDAPGTDETAVLRIDDEALHDAGEAEGALVCPAEPRDEPETREAPLELADEGAPAAAASPRDLASALEYFESAAGTAEPEDVAGEGEAPIELSDVVEPTNEAAATAAQEDEAPWTFALDEAETGTGGITSDETDAAFAPEPEPDPEERAFLDAPLSDEEVAAFEAMATSPGRKPIVLGAIAAAVAGLVFLTFGGSEPSTPAPSSGVAKEAASTPSPPLATPGRGFVDPEVIAALPQDALAKAVAEAEAAAALAAAAPSTLGPADGAGLVRPAAPMRETRAGEPEATRRPRTEPTVRDESFAANDPTLDGSEPSGRESPAKNAARPLVAKKDAPDSKEGATDVDGTPSALPASPRTLTPSGEEERFW